MEFQSKGLVVKTGYDLVTCKEILWDIGKFDLLGSQEIIVEIEENNDVPATRYYVYLSNDSKITLKYFEMTGENLNCNRNVFYHALHASFLGFDGEKVWKSFKSRMFDIKKYCQRDNEREREVFSFHDLPPQLSPYLDDESLRMEIKIEIYRKRSDSKTETDTKSMAVRPAKQHDLKQGYYFQQFLKSDNLSDIQIISSDEQKFPAHKLILIVASEVFEAMFRSDMSESKTGIIKIDDLYGDAVNFLLQYIYTKEILPFSVNGTLVKGNSEKTQVIPGTEKTKHVTVEEVLYIAAKYRLEGVKDFVDSSFRNLCDEESALYLFRLSKNYGLRCTKMLMAFIKNNPRLLDELLLEDFNDMVT